MQRVCDWPSPNIPRFGSGRQTKRCTWISWVGLAWATNWRAKYPTHTGARLPERQTVLAARVADQKFAIWAECQRGDRVRMGRNHLAFVLTQLVDGEISVASTN